MTAVYIVEFCQYDQSCACLSRRTVFVSDSDDRAAGFIKQHGRKYEAVVYGDSDYWFTVTKAHINDVSGIEVINKFDIYGNPLPNQDDSETD